MSQTWGAVIYVVIFVGVLLFVAVVIRDLNRKQRSDAETRAELERRITDLERREKDSG